MNTTSPNNKFDGKPKAAAFALTLTLIMLALTAVTVLAFLSTSRTERGSAAGYARIDKANLFAQAGAEAAIARITTEMQYRPFHAIGYRTLSVGTGAQPVTETIPIITGPRTTNPGTATYNTAPDTTQDVYLLSAPGSATANSPPGSLAPSNLDDKNSIDLNANHLSTEPKGWIGSPVAGPAPTPYRAPWIDVLRDPTKLPQPDPTGANYNPVVGRYAYWLEDETSKLDSSIAGNKDNGDAFKHEDGVNLPDNKPPRFAANDLDIGALPLLNGAPLPTGDTATNKAVIDFRATQPIPDARFLNRVGALTATVHETTKFYETSFSLSDDLAGTGRRRANLNGLVTNTTSPGAIAANIDDIAYVITGNHLIGNGGTLGPLPDPGARVFEAAPTTTNALTNFGNRFFTSSTPSVDQAKMYVERIAANIRDYIDTDSQPTYINTSDQVVSNAKPVLAWKNGTEPRAVGKEAIPYLNEIVWYGFQRSMTPNPQSSPSSATYDVDIDFYLEFVNPTTKDFTAPNGAFLKVYDRAGWSTGSFGTLTPPDAEYLIQGITFPAGAATVLTSQPDPNQDPPGLILSPNSVHRITGGQRHFVGITDEPIGTPPHPGLQFNGRAGTSKTTDYTTEALWGTPTGIYEACGYVCSGGASPNGALANNWNMDGKAAEMNNKTRFVFSYGLRGNDDKSRTGDPRSLSEQLSMTGGLSTLGLDQTRFYADIQGNGVIPQKTTIGKSTTTYVDPTKWPDYTPALADSAATAIAIQRDDAMQSIGELGYIYDPVRTVAATDQGPAPSILRARGGGRTLKIGQIDDLITGVRFSPSWFNAAWRLTDLFSADLTKNGTDYVKVSNPTSRGKININGVLRDDGVAFTAALRSFNFLPAPNSDPQLSGAALSSDEIAKLTNEVKTYLTTKGPFMERGEISQLPFFSSTGGETAGGKSLATANDRAREEIFRRCVEMITTRSASFTVYAVGEAITQDKNGNKKPAGQKRLAITFQLDPKKGNALLQASAVPYDAVDSYSARRVYAPN